MYQNNEGSRSHKTSSFSKFGMNYRNSSFTNKFSDEGLKQNFSECYRGLNSFSVNLKEKLDLDTSSEINRNKVVSNLKISDKNWEKNETIHFRDILENR